MGNTGKTARRSANLLKTRPTIAFLGPGLHATISMSLWPGLVDAAQEHDINLLYVAGESLRSPDSLKQANVLFDLFNAKSVDGIVSWTSTLGSFISHEELSTFLTCYKHVPMVSVGKIMKGIPSLVMDSYQGMYAAVTHLIEVHGFRRLAFIRGPEDHFYAQERYRAYTEALKAHGLPIDPRLITSSYEWMPSYGVKAIQLLLDERGLRPQADVEAVVSVNDKMALGALQALQAREIRIPQDVAVVGFNDDPESRFNTPPLTSVMAPFYELGERAVKMVLALIEGESVPEQVSVPAKLVVRQSCGCLSLMVEQAAVGTVVATNERGKSLLTERREELLAEIIHAIGTLEFAPKWAGQFLEAFMTEVLDGTAGAFLSALNDVLRHTAAARGDVEVWHGALSALRRHVLSCLGSDETLMRAEDLWQQARVEIGEMAKRIQGYHDLQARQQIQMVRELGATLITTFDVPGLMDILAEGLPRVGIPSCYLALYEEPETPTEWARLMLAYTEQGRVELGPGGLRFPSSQLVPEDLLPGDQRTTLIIEALYFQEEQIGFAVFEVGPRDGTVYGILRGEISSALQGALLMQRVQSRSAELVQANAALAREKYVIDTFMANVPDRIYFKDLHGRITRANQAHARVMGFNDPAEEIDKTDFDFFPEEQARPKYEQEQEIIRTGQPLLAMEEPDARGQWALTTKMPLRDEHGEIIGTFGISRDITELKHAQNALEQAYSEISILNRQLQEENLRMSAELDVARRLQEMILPPPEELQQIESLDIVGYMQPADEVGGDYYDVLQENGIIHIGIGDVTGHGLESGVLMLMTQTVIRTLIEHGETDPMAFVSTLNRTIYKNARRMGAGKTLTFALVNYQDGQLKIVGQHEELLVIRNTGQVERVDTIDLGFPIGLEEEIVQWVAEATVSLQPGDGVVLYTDGIIEAANMDNTLYGLERLCDVVSQHWDKRAEEIKQAVIDDVIRYIGEQKVYDDLTLVVLKQQ